MGLRAVEPGNEDPVVVEIPNGSGASMIVEYLDEVGLVRSRFWAKVNAKLGGYNSLQANTYVFNRSMAFNQMMSIINEGNYEYVSKESIEVGDGARCGAFDENIGTDDGFAGGLVNHLTGHGSGLCEKKASAQHKCEQKCKDSNKWHTDALLVEHVEVFFIG